MAYAPRNRSKGSRAVDKAVYACSFLNIHATRTRELRPINCSQDFSIPAEKAITTEEARSRFNNELFPQVITARKRKKVLAMTSCSAVNSKKVHV